MTRSLSVFAALMGLGCGGATVQSKPLDSVESVAAGPTVLSGTLLGHDGKPMPQAHVHVGGSSHQTGTDGSFRVEVDEPFAVASFTGVDHAELSIGIATADGSVELDIQLGTYRRPAEMKQLSLATYDLPVPEGTVPRSTRRWPMVQGSNGVFSATIKSTNPDDKELGYHVIGIAVNRNINGPQSDSFVYDNGGDYISVVKVNDGVARVELDTRKLVPAGKERMVSFAKPESTAARVARVFLDSDRSQLNEGYAQEKNEWVRSAKMLTFLTNPSEISGGAEELTAAMTKVAGLVVKEIPVDSPLWQMAPDALFALMQFAEGGAEYAEQVARSSKDRNTAAQILFSLLFSADRSGDVEAMRRLQKLFKDEFADTPFARQAESFDPDRRIMVGKPLPAFDYEEWGGARRVTPASLKGKEVYIKFWATWCKPCIAEMGKLHELWEEKKDTEFALISININDSAEAMERFRKDKWPMPWTNIYLDSGQSPAAMELWEVVGIPKSIRADKDGIIREVHVGASME